MPSWIFGPIGKLILGAALLLGIGIAIRWYGHTKFQDGVDSVATKINKQTEKKKEKANKVSVDLNLKYVVQLNVIHGQTQTLLQKVPIYVTQKDNARCTINVGFVSLWNSSNKGLLPSSARTANEAASPVVLSDVAAQHTRESGLGRSQQQQLIDLQEWVRKEYEVINGHKLQYH